MEGEKLGSVVYCVLPAGLAAELHDPLRAHYREELNPARFAVLAPLALGSTAR